MTSTSAAKQSSAMVETRNWLEIPDEIMGPMILQRLGAVEILISAQKVCTTWRKICKDPAMWKVIDMHHSFEFDTRDIENLARQAVFRSCWELIDISLDGFGTDDLLEYISRCSSKLNSLRLTNCDNITRSGLTYALKRLPHLETLDLFNIYICSNDIEVIGRICPRLKFFKMKTRFMECDDDAYAIAYAIADSMPALCHLQLFGITMTDDGLQAILHGCPHLESLDLHNCSFLDLGENLVKLCRERIKDFKFTLHNLPAEEYELSDMDLSDYHEEYESSDMDLSDDEYYEFSGGSKSSAEDDDDY